MKIGVKKFGGEEGEGVIDDDDDDDEVMVCWREGRTWGEGTYLS